MSSYKKGVQSWSSKLGRKRKVEGNSKKKGRVRLLAERRRRICQAAAVKEDGGRNEKKAIRRGSQRGG